ncbi:hypothetical protein BKA65DRAFT_483296 [Rhexocercosporidium sp. MPI-PUGE-AT-0058]|nr:hypothetical protein BKA65DRAFT_483296 [Rhexocercosporidium sp. MPI-PUGE-AT-0058]
MHSFPAPMIHVPKLSVTVTKNFISSKELATFSGTSTTQNLLYTHLEQRQTPNLQVREPSKYTSNIILGITIPLCVLFVLILFVLSGNHKKRPMNTEGGSEHEGSKHAPTRRSSEECRQSVEESGKAEKKGCKRESQEREEDKNIEKIRKKKQSVVNRKSKRRSETNRRNIKRNNRQHAARERYQQ